MISELRRRWALDSLDQLGFFERIQWMDRVDSTNRHLDRQIKSGQIPLPCIAIADEQTSGVGRGANRWFSPPGCLMFSIAIEHSRPDPHRNAPSVALLPLLVGLAVARALKPRVRSQPKVKWPNDVYIEDRKVCGILIESNTAGSMGYAIIGIGINCKVDLNHAPWEVRQTAVSLHEVMANGDSEESTCESVLVAFVQSWLELGSLCETQPDWVERNWPDWDWLVDRQIQVQQPSRTLFGKADGIGPDGSLRLIDSDANRHTILSGSVRVID